MQKGFLDKVDGKFMMTEINLTAKLKIDDLSKASKAERVLQKSEAACLISNSIKTQVNLTCEIS
jgi:organic hydroperoxide reductase OsmC/OhrA